MLSIFSLALQNLQDREFIVAVAVATQTDKALSMMTTA